MDLQPGNKCECPKTFKTYDDFKNHVITHDPDTKVECEICGKVLENPCALSAHIKDLHTKTDRSSCDTCHRVFPNPTNLRIHMKIVHSQRPGFPCTFPGCGMNYQNEGDVLQHMQTEHADNPVRFPCKICGKVFKRRARLEIHIPTHKNEKPYQCATCGRSFAQKGNLKSHEMTHLEKSSRVMSNCHLCPKTFLNRRGLHRHIRVGHENESNYPCASCDKRFCDSFSLKVHVEAIHATNQELIHSCDKCEFKTNSEDNLALHGKQHEPGNDSQESLMSLLSLWEEIPYFSGMDPTSSD